MTQLTASQLDGLTFSDSDILTGSATADNGGTYDFTTALNAGLLGNYTVTFSNGNDATGQVTVTINGGYPYGGATGIVTLDGNDAADFLVNGSIPGLGSGYAFISNVPTNGGPGTTEIVQPLGPNNTYTPACYAAGTRIATARGEVAVEDLEVGDLAVTLDGDEEALSAIRWIGRSRINLARHPCRKRVAPILIKAHAFGEGAPHRDLLLSPDHSVLFEDALIPAHLLVNGTTVVRKSRMRAVTYFHVECEHHTILLADGLPAESYLDTGNRAAFENGGVVQMLYPDFAAQRWEADACCELVVTGPLLDDARAHLAGRAKELAKIRQRAAVG